MAWRWQPWASHALAVARHRGGLPLPDRLRGGAPARLGRPGALPRHVAAGFGLSLLLLLQSTELARCVRHATVDAGLARSQIIHWFGFAAAAPAATFSAMPVAIALAALMPFAAAPVVAAAGALGAVLALAATVIRPQC